jgi:hypothetical protein
MSSTFSDLKVELITTGEQSNTWGTTTNTNLGTALEEAIVGRATATFTTDGNLTISLTDTNATQVARNYILNVVSGVSLTATRSLIVPSIDKPYIIENNTSGGQSILVKTSAGTGVTVPNGKKTMVYADTTNVVSAEDYKPTLTLGTPLVAASGGTGLSSLGSGVATFLGTPSSSNLAAAVTDETGSGFLVFATSPTLITPILGTPTSGTLTNCTGFPTANLSGLGSGVATFLATPSSSNLAAAVTDETGSGALVFATSPTLVTPALGTPSSGTLSSCTGFPTANLSGLGSGVATFLATPSSANLAAAVTDETGSGALVFGTSPAITSPTLTNPSAVGTLTEDVYTITDGAGFAIDPTNGSIQLITLGASRTPTQANWTAGQGVTLMINDGTAYTITWTTIGVVWVGGTAPTLATSGYTDIELWKVATTVYGALVGNVA